MAHLDPNLPISSYAQLLLSDQQDLAKLLLIYGTSIKKSITQTPILTEGLLAVEIIDTALAGPFQPMLKMLIHYFTLVARVRCDFKFKDEELFNKEKKNNFADKLPDDEIAKVNTGILSGIEKQLKSKLKEIDKAWQALCHEGVQEVLQQLLKNGVELSEIEIKEMRDLETITDVENRFTDLNIPRPKLAKREDMDIALYLTLKADIAIQSSLSRRQLPHEQKDIDKLLKPLKNIFKQIFDQEKVLLKHQRSELNTIVAAIAFASKSY